MSSVNFNDIYTIEFDSLDHETDDAYKVIIEDAEIWFPKSECMLEEAINTIDVPGWLVAKKEDEHNIELL